MYFTSEVWFIQDVTVLDHFISDRTQFEIKIITSVVYVLLYMYFTSEA